MWLIDGMTWTDWIRTMTFSTFLWLFLAWLFFDIFLLGGLLSFCWLSLAFLRHRFNVRLFFVWFSKATSEHFLIACASLFVSSNNTYDFARREQILVPRTCHFVVMFRSLYASSSWMNTCRHNRCHFLLHWWTHLSILELIICLLNQLK